MGHDKKEEQERKERVKEAAAACRRSSELSRRSRSAIPEERTVAPRPSWPIRLLRSIRPMHWLRSICSSRPDEGEGSSTHPQEFTCRHRRRGAVREKRPVSLQSPRPTYQRADNMYVETSFGASASPSRGAGDSNSRGAGASSSRGAGNASSRGAGFSSSRGADTSSSHRAGNWSSRRAGNWSSRRPGTSFTGGTDPSSTGQTDTSSAGITSTNTTSAGTSSAGTSSTPGAGTSSADSPSNRGAGRTSSAGPASNKNMITHTTSTGATSARTKDTCGAGTRHSGAGPAQNHTTFTHTTNIHTTSALSTFACSTSARATSTRRAPTTTVVVDVHHGRSAHASFVDRPPIVTISENPLTVSREVEPLGDPSDEIEEFPDYGMWKATRYLPSEPRSSPSTPGSNGPKPKPVSVMCLICARCQCKKCRLQCQAIGPRIFNIKVSENNAFVKKFAWAPCVTRKPMCTSEESLWTYNPVYMRRYQRCAIKWKVPGFSCVCLPGIHIFTTFDELTSKKCSYNCFGNIDVDGCECVEWEVVLGIRDRARRRAGRNKRNEVHHEGDKDIAAAAAFTAEDAGPSTSDHQSCKPSTSSHQGDGESIYCLCNETIRAIDEPDIDEPDIIVDPNQDDDDEQTNPYS